MNGSPRRAKPEYSRSPQRLRSTIQEASTFYRYEDETGKAFFAPRTHETTDACVLLESSSCTLCHALECFEIVTGGQDAFFELRVRFSFHISHFRLPSPFLMRLFSTEPPELFFIHNGVRVL